MPPGRPPKPAHLELTSSSLAFLEHACDEARSARHIWPEYAACEAALESGYGKSELAKDDHNLFGMKQHRHHLFGTVNLPTEEWKNGAWAPLSAAFIKYPDDAACFRDRMATLVRLANEYPHYKAALDSKDGRVYVQQVSLTWSTDPHRGDKVLAIYDAWQQAQVEALKTAQVKA